MMHQPEPEIIIIGRMQGPLSHFVSQLEAEGVKALPEDEPAAAKAHLSSGRPGLAVVFMEGLSGPLDVIRELLFLYRGLPVLAVSATGSVHDARQAIDAGAADYFLLPVERDVIREALARYKGRYFDPELGRGRHFITGDPGMKRLLTQARRVAPSRATVLIQGESGTGKELIARYLHQVSDRSQAPFVAINCAALPDNLLESELFGHTKGAFTGAVAERKGRFQQADGGTLFLDEVSEMDLNLQAKLLRVLQEGEVDPLGGRSPIKVDVRIVASTNRDLKAWVGEGRFREDLFYRLNVFPVMLPPLRERTTDILLLAEHFRVRFVAELGRNDVPFSKEARASLTRHPWEGNVRELENVIHRALLVAEGYEVTSADLMIEPVDLAESSQGADEFDMPVGTTVREMEELLIRRTLSEVNGNRTQAAKLLGISIRTLRNKLHEYGDRDLA